VTGSKGLATGNPCDIPSPAAQPALHLYSTLLVCGMQMQANDVMMTGCNIPENNDLPITPSMTTNIVPESWTLFVSGPANVSIRAFKVSTA